MVFKKRRISDDQKSDKKKAIILVPEDRGFKPTEIENKIELINKMICLTVGLENMVDLINDLNL
jgi:hypothetical protein